MHISCYGIAFDVVNGLELSIVAERYVVWWLFRPAVSTHRTEILIMIFYDVNPCDVATVRLCGSQRNDIYHIGIFLLHGHYLLQVVTELRKEMLLCVVRCCPGIASHFIYFPVGEMRNGDTVGGNGERQIGRCISLGAFGQGYDLFESCLGRCESDRILRKLVGTWQNPATLCFKDNVEALFVCNFYIRDTSSGIVFLVHNHYRIRVRNQSTDMLHH